LNTSIATLPSVATRHWAMVYCDAKVTGTQRFSRGDATKLNSKGGGGRRFKPVFEYLQDMDEQVAAPVYLTDLYGDNLRTLDEPSYPVVWGVTYGELQDVPFGRAVKVNV